MTKNEKIRLLYVEDNPDDIELLKLVLDRSDLSFQLDSAGTWKEFEKFSLDDFDVVVSDYNLRGLTGLDVIHEVKNKRPEMPVIILTGTVGEELAVQLMHAGADDFLLKPNIKKIPILINKAMRSMVIEREKQRFQQEIVEKNMLLDTILDCSKAGIFLKDIDGKYLKVNQAVCDFLELRKDEIIGRVASDIWPKDAAEGSRQIDMQVIEHGLPIDYELAFFDGGGKFRAAEIRKTPLKDADNRVIGIVGEIRNITKQRQLMDELKKSQGILSLAENITGSASFEYNAELDLLTVSRNFKTITGLKVEGDQISLRRLALLFKKEDREIFIKAATEAIENRQNYSGYHRLEIDRKTLNFRIFLRPDSRGENEHTFFGTLLDVTADTENDQLQFNLQEEDRKEIARELHDNLGQKFNAVSMFLSKIIEDEPDNMQLIKTREIVHDAIDDLGRLINTISAKQIEEHNLTYALEKLFSYVDESIQVETKFDFVDQEIAHHIKEHIYRVVQEAVNNVAKYSKASKLIVELVQDHSMLDLRIEDDGVGFDMIGDLPGNGLKNMIYRIQKSNGLINIHAEKGKGTRIVAKLPCN